MAEANEQLESQLRSGQARKEDYDIEVLTQGEVSRPIFPKIPTRRFKRLLVLPL